MTSGAKQDGTMDPTGMSTTKGNIKRDEERTVRRPGRTEK